MLSMEGKAKRLTIFILIALTSLLVVGGIMIKRTFDFVDRAYYYESFMDGRVTRDEARAVVGSVADTWPEPEKE